MYDIRCMSIAPYYPRTAFKSSRNLRYRRCEFAVCGVAVCLCVYV